MIVEYARHCIGTPYLHQGRQIGLGMDCPAPLVYVLQQLGKPYIDCKAYPPRPYQGMLEKILDNEPSLKQIPKDDLQPGDILLLRIKRHPQHLAIFTGENIIHAFSNIGRVVEQPLRDAWRKRIMRVYRII